MLANTGKIKVFMTKILTASILLKRTCLSQKKKPYPLSTTIFFMHVCTTMFFLILACAHSGLVWQLISK